MITKIQDNIFQLSFKEFSSCVYVLKIKKNIILIDTGSEQAKQELLLDLKQLNLTPKQINIIFLTHHHWDHDANKDLFRNAKIYDSKNFSKFKLKGFKIILVPGHTKDSLAILYKNILFSGDTLFHKGIGRTDFPESAPREMQESVNKLLRLNYKILCPGHV